MSARSKLSNAAGILLFFIVFYLLLMLILFAIAAPAGIVWLAVSRSLGYLLLFIPYPLLWWGVAKMNKLSDVL